MTVRFDHSINLGITFLLAAVGYLDGGMEMVLPYAVGAFVGTYGYDLLCALRGQ